MPALRKRVFLVLFSLVFSSSVFSQNATLSGYVSDLKNSETLIGAVVFVKGTGKGISTNLYGFYSLSLAVGEYDVTYSCLGYSPITHHVNLKADQTLNVKLTVSESVIKEVTISASKDEKKEEVRSTQMSMIKIPIDRIKSIPTIGGETDVIKVMQLMPGVKRGGEGQSGMYVRGGAGDENLILLDEAVVYNVAHLFGFFSVFNNDALKDVTLIKGGFPASYGGRLSSVMDVRMKEGDMQKYHVEGGIGLLSSRLTIQGPIIKDKASFIISGRRSYIDQVFKLAGTDLPYYFFDFTTKFNYKISDRDRLYLSTYAGDDVLSASSGDSSLFEGGFTIGNRTTTIRWNHLFNSKLFSNLSLISTKFRYDVEANVPGNSFLARSDIQDLGLKLDYDYYKNTETRITYGGSLIGHEFRPNVINTSGEISNFLRSEQGKAISTPEFGIYYNKERSLDSLHLKINYGLRISVLSTQKTAYAGIEPRLSFTYLLNENRSLKFSYSRMKQYMHLVSSSSVSLPTDLWYPVTKNVKPQIADQIAAGYTQNLEKVKSMLTIEAYYKWMHNLIEYRPGAVLILNDNYESELISGKGSAYGFEVFLNKTHGRFTGWLGYTISWSKRQFNDLNFGGPFYSKYDRRHDISLVGTFEITKKVVFSAVWVYSTGSRFTATTGQFLMPNASLTSVDILPLYSQKNAIELPASHRLDLNFIIKRKPSRKWEGEWHLGAYNFYNRAQPYKIEIAPGKSPGTYKYVASGLFGFIPSIAYNFKF